MSFKENLKKKIEIDKAAKTVIDSIGPPGSGHKINREVMKNLLETGAFEKKQVRDLDLYFLKGDPGEEKILVLDNELAIYSTSPEDIALRKSPTLKEMLSIRNAVKILNDADVVKSKRAESVESVRQECIDMLDLSFQESDIEKIEQDGAISLERGHTEGVLQVLAFFSELLGYTPLPANFNISRYKLLGAPVKKDKGKVILGPVVIYSIINNTIMLIKGKTSGFEKEKAGFIHNVATGKEEADAQGSEVFQYLKKEVLKS